MSRELKAAIILWKRGQKIDAFLYAALVIQGYDVPLLERRYRA